MNKKTDSLDILVTWGLKTMSLFLEKTLVEKFQNFMLDKKLKEPNRNLYSDCNYFF